MRGRCGVGSAATWLLVLALTACSDKRDFASAGGGAGAAGASTSSAGASSQLGGMGGAMAHAGAGGDDDLAGAGAGGTPEIVCTPNQPVCDGDRATLCNSTGTGYEGDGEPCSSTQLCRAGSCEELECTPSARFCEGDTVRLCADNGLSSEKVETCLAGEYCDSASATCKTGVCSPGEPACDGARATTCNSSGSGYAAEGETCKANETCSVGECRPHTCTPSASFCQGQDVKACSETGLSSTVVTTCANQACVESGDSASCSGVCSPGQVKCSGNGVQTCSGNGTWGAAAACPAATPRCAAGVCGAPASCAGLASACGPNGNDSCCSSPSLPAGTYNRSNDASYPATISAFRLDRYEITVGRFRKFLAAYSQDMIAAGAGKNPNNPADAGWSTDFNASLPLDAAALKAAIKCNTGQQNNNYETWTDTVGGNELRPINCLSWYVAAALCIWDGGRLPTEAEWNYAAAGGSEQRQYPWGPTAPGNNANLAVFGCYFGGIPGAGCVDVTNIAPVGSVSAGNGRWGQANLAGNLNEWVADWYTSPYAQTTCNNCVNVSGTAQMQRVVRNGGFASFADELVTSYRLNYTPETRTTGTGARCARAQ